MSNERELIHRCGRGEADALQHLIRRYADEVRRLLVKLLGRSEDVDDVLGEVFVRLWRSAGRYRGDCAPHAWVYRITVSAATDVLRQRRSRAEEPLLPEQEAELRAPAAHGPEATLFARMREERCAELARAAMDGLPPDERVAVTLHYLEELSYREAAEVLGCPVTTVRMRLVRARRRMLAYLKDRVEYDELPLLGLGPETNTGLAPCVEPLS